MWWTVPAPWIPGSSGAGSYSQREPRFSPRTSHLSGPSSNSSVSRRNRSLRAGDAVYARAPSKPWSARAAGISGWSATSGMYAVNDKALPLLAEPYETGAPEVEALLRVSEAGLRLEEVPVNMRERASGESKLRGRKAVKLVLTVTGALAVGILARRRR